MSQWCWEGIRSADELLWFHRLVIVRNTNDGLIRFRLAGHRARLTTLAFSPDGRTLVTGDDDGSVRLWNVRVGQEMLDLGHPGVKTMDLQFSADGQHLFFNACQLKENDHENNVVLIFHASDDEASTADLR